MHLGEQITAAINGFLYPLAVFLLLILIITYFLARRSALRILSQSKQLLDLESEKDQLLIALQERQEQQGLRTDALEAEQAEIQMQHEAIHKLQLEVMEELKQLGSEAEANGYAFLPVADEYKPIFADAMSGFTEFAHLKGYRVTLAYDLGIPGKVAIKVAIVDGETSVSTGAVRRDVDEYITKLRNSDDLGNMPIVTNPVEHERLVAALKMRFSFVKHQSELHAATSEFYKNLLAGVKDLTHVGIGYSIPAQVTQIHLTNDGRRAMGDVFNASNSPGAAVGRSNKVAIEESSINVGSTVTERSSQADGLKELIALLQSDPMPADGKDVALRNLKNAHEEIQEKSPDKGLIEKYLLKAKSVFTTLTVGAELIEKAKSVFALFGLSF